MSYLNEIDAKNLTTEDLLLEILKELMLLNMRFEEAFDTKLKDIDIEEP